MTEKINDPQVEVEETPVEEATETVEAISSPAEETEAETTVEASPDLENLQNELEAAQTEATKNLEGWQRAAADLANYKRRQEEQAGRQRIDITARIIQDVLPALDDLDLAFQNLPESLNEQETSWVEGFKLVQRKLTKLLENNNIQTIITEGDFDPNLHEAVTYEESPDHNSNTIIAELRKGYCMGNRVIRPALVRVAQ